MLFYCVDDDAVASGLVNAVDAVTATAADAGVLVSQFIGGLFDTDTGAAQAFFEAAANESRRNKMTPERMAEIGFKDFAPPFKNTCENHGGSGLAAVQQWDAKAKKWNMITEYMYLSLIHI